MFDFLYGIDLSQEKVGYENDGEEYFFMNVGSVNYYPGGPSCTYKGKTVPCLVSFSEGGGILGHILTNILRHLDYLKLY